ncbi:MAG: PD40 domain-containing protein, partial [Verrucomicrobiae bacterium]|nr:PD40 domain-containing protein [Verrucomicrobiae bacterium]
MKSILLDLTRIGHPFGRRALPLLLWLGLAGGALGDTGPGNIVYVQDFDLWRAEADGTGKTALGFNAEGYFCYDAALSPDGNWIAFNAQGPSPSEFGLFLAKAEPFGPSNQPIHVTDDWSIQHRVAWHPGGRYLAYTSDSQTTPYSQVYLVRVFDGAGLPDVGAPEALTASNGFMYFADCAFTPDGRELVTSQFGAALIKFPVFDANGDRTGSLIDSFQTPFTEQNSGEATWPSFSPDGDRIAFVHRDFNTQRYGVAILDIRDGMGAFTPEDAMTNPRTIHVPVPAMPVGSETVTSVSWSPDGTKIAFGWDDGSFTRFVSVLNASEPENGTTNPRMTIAGETGAAGADFPSFAQPGEAAPVVLTMAPPLNLVSWWPGENAPWDIVGIGWGSMKTGPGSTVGDAAAAYGPGLVGRAFAFDGVDDHIEGRPTGISLVQDLTIEAWVNPDSLPTEAAIVSKRDDDDQNVSYALLLRDGVPVFLSRNAGLDDELSAPDPIPTGAWTHLAFTESATGGRKLYVNGVAVATLAGPAPLRPTTFGVLTLGAVVTAAAPSSAPDAPFDGLIDELSLYNRALTAAEISGIVQVGAGGKDRHDPARDFSATLNPGPEWGFGFFKRDANPIDVSYLTDGNSATGRFFAAPATANGDSFFYDITTVAPGLAIFNNSDVDRFADSGIDLGPLQIGLNPALSGAYTVMRWTAPESGRYALSATFTGNHTAGATSDVHVFHNNASLFDDVVGGYLGDGVSVTENPVPMTAGDVVDWIVGYDASTGSDATGLVASAVLLDQSQFQNPLILQFKFNEPLMTGKTVFVQAHNSARVDYPTMTAKIQYSANPGNPASWIDLPGGTMNPIGSQSFELTLNNLPAGDYAFRILNSVTGVGDSHSAPTEVFHILPRAPYHEAEIQAIPDSDPSGATTHRGDRVTYRVRFRNAGGESVPPSENLKIRAVIPPGTVYKGATGGGRKAKDGFVEWKLIRNLNPVDSAPEFTVSSVKSDVLFAPNHGFDDGEKVVVRSTGTAPGGIVEGTEYTVVNSTSNTLKLALPPSTKPIDILDFGTGVHTVTRTEAWQTREFTVEVNDPTYRQENKPPTVDPGDTIITHARITGPSDSDILYLSQPAQSQIVNPLRLFARLVPGSQLKKGGLVDIDLIVRNEAGPLFMNKFSRARDVNLYVQAPAGLSFITGSAYVDTGGQTTDSPVDPRTHKQVPSPQLLWHDNGVQSLFVQMGSMNAGAEYRVRARFRVQYDWDTATHPVIVFTQAQASMQRNGGRNPFARTLETSVEFPAVEFPVADAPNDPRPFLDVAMTQAAAGFLPGSDIAVVTTRADKLAGTNPLRKTNEILYRVTYRNFGSVRAEWIRVWAPIPDQTSLVAKSAVVIRDPADLVIQNVTGDAATNVFTTPQPHQFAPGDRVQFPTLKGGGTGVKGGTVTYYVHSTPAANTFTVAEAEDDPSPADFTRNLTGKVKQEGFGVNPIVVGNSLIFQLPYLEPFGVTGWEKSLEFRVAVKKGTPLFTDLVQPGAVVNSLELTQAAEVRHDLVAEVSEPAQMRYTDDEAKVIRDIHDEDMDNDFEEVLEVRHQCFYENTGQIPAEDVQITYDIQPGYLFVDAEFLDADGDPIIKSLFIQKPAVNATSGRITFPVGTVSKSTFTSKGKWISGGGWVRVRVKPDPANPPATPPVGEDGYRRDAGFVKSDATTPAPLLRRSPALPNLIPTSIAPGNVWLGVYGIEEANAGDEITYHLFWGSSSRHTPGAGAVIFPIPDGTTYVRHSAAIPLSGQSSNHTGNHNAPGAQPGYPNGNVAWGHNIAGGEAQTAYVTVRIDNNALGSVFARGARISGDQAGVVVAPTCATVVRNLYPDPAVILRIRMEDQFGSVKLTDRAFGNVGGSKILNGLLDVDGNSSWLSFAGAGAIAIPGHNTLLIPLRNGKIVAAGGGNIVAGGGGNVIQDAGGATIVAGGGGNIVAAGGGNIVAAGGGNVIRIDIPRGPVTGLITVDDLYANLRRIVAGGGGNIVAGGGGNVVANDGAGVVANDGAGVVANDGAGLIGLDGASLIGKWFSDPDTGQERIEPVNLAEQTFFIENVSAAWLGNGGEGIAEVLATGDGDGGVFVDPDGLARVPANALIGHDGAT